MPQVSLGSQFRVIFHFFYSHKYIYHSLLVFWAGQGSILLSCYSDFVCIGVGGM